jgi:hypothetical protein
MRQIFYFTGIGLIILGGLSGFFLFYRAISTRKKEDEEAGRSTLWGLFLFGVIGGIILIVLLYSIH